MTHNFQFYANPKVVIPVTKPKLTSTNPTKHTRNSILTLLTKDPQYYGKLHVAATDSDDTASLFV